MKKYNSFIELTEAFAGREGTALEYLAEDGNIGSVSYKELAEKIKERAAFYATKGPGTDYVYAKPEPDAVVEIFAAVYAKRCIIMNTGSRQKPSSKPWIPAWSISFGINTICPYCGPEAGQAF